MIINIECNEHKILNFFKKIFQYIPNIPIYSNIF